MGQAGVAASLYLQPSQCGAACSLAVGETVILLHTPLICSRYFNKDGEGGGCSKMKAPPLAGAAAPVARPAAAQHAKASDFGGIAGKGSGHPTAGGRDGRATIVGCD